MSSSVSSSSLSSVIAQSTPVTPSPTQVRESVVEKSAALIVKDLDAIFEKEMNFLGDLHTAGKALPEGTVTCFLRSAKSPTDVVPAYFFRPQLMRTENSSTSVESDVKGLSDPQANIYNAVLSRSIHKILKIADYSALALNLVRCESEIRTTPTTFDYNKSAILRSKVVAVALRAPMKVLVYFA